MPIGRVEKTGSVFRWRVEEFSTLEGIRYYYSSPYIHFCGRRWYLDLFLNRSERNAPISVGLDVLLKYGEPPIEARYSVGIQTACGATEVWTEGTHTFRGSLSDRIVQCTRVERSEVLRRREELLPGDALTVTVTLWVVEGAFERDAKNSSVQATVETDVAAVQATVETEVADVSVQATVGTNAAEVSVQTEGEDRVAVGGKCEPLEKMDVEKLREHFRLWLEHPEEGERIRRLRMEELEKREKREKVVKKQPPEKEWNFFAA